MRERHYRVARKGGRIEVPHHLQAMVWCSDVVLIKRQQNGLLSRGISEISREVAGRSTQHDLPTDFFKVSLGYEVESRGSSFGHRRR